MMCYRIYFVISLISCILSTITTAQPTVLWDYLGNRTYSGIDIETPLLTGKSLAFLIPRDEGDTILSTYFFGSTINAVDIKMFNTVIPKVGFNSFQILPNKKVLWGSSNPPTVLITDDNVGHFDTLADFELKYRTWGNVRTMNLSRQGVLYVGLQGGLLIRSTDFGNTWQVCPHTGLGPEKVYFDNNDNLYLQSEYSGIRRLHRTTNFGQSWQRLDSILLQLEDISRFGESLSSYIFYNKLYFYHYNYNGSRLLESFIRSNLDGTNREVLKTTPYDFREVHGDSPEYIICDSSGGLHGLCYFGSMQYSNDSGRTWKETAYIDKQKDARIPKFDTVQHIFPDTALILGAPWNHFTALLDGHIHLSQFHYLSRFTVPMPPQRLASINRCGYATATFVSDSLSSVEWIKAGSMNVDVRFDTIANGRSIQVHIQRIDSTKFAHFYIKATNVRGFRTEWSEDMYPKQQQSLQLHKAKKKQNVDTLDAGFAVQYIWYRDGKEVMLKNYNLSGWFYRTIPLDTPGTYWCEIFDTTGCVQTTQPYTYNPVSVNDEPNDDIHVFPNPANESITITGIGDVMHDIEITDVLGNVALVSDTKHCISTGIMMIDIATLPNGVYGIRIPTITGIYRTRFVVAR